MPPGPARGVGIAARRTVRAYGSPVYLKSDAIVIDRRPIMNTSFVLWCYTRRAGRLMVLAKGAQRRRRKGEPPSVPDLFQRGEVVLWFGPRRENAILREWTLEHVRRGIRNDYGAFHAASACAALVGTVSRHSSGPAEHFGALDLALSALDSGGAPRPVLWAFVLQIMSRAGFLAPLTSCVVCGRRARGDGPAVWSPSDGGMLCSRCDARRGVRGEGQPSVVLSPEAAAAARFLSTTPVESVSALHVSSRSADLLDRAVKVVAEYHLEEPMNVLLPVRSAFDAPPGEDPS